MPGDYWFKPKTYGYGARPANWKGWLATAVFLLVCLAWAGLTVGQDPPPRWGAMAFVIGLMVLIVGFSVLARKKTDGEWRWQWGNGAWRRIWDNKDRN